MSDITSINSSFVQNSLNTSSSSVIPGSPTAPASSNGGDLLRITGMASGLNVDQMVSQMMAPYQMQIDKVQQEEQKVQWKQQMYVGIINDVKSFQDTYFNAASPSMNITSAAFFNTTVGNSSDPNSIGITTTSTASNGNYTVQVNNLAKSASISGSSLNSQVAMSGISGWSGGSISFNVNGNAEQIQLDTLISTGNNVNDAENIVSNINSKLNQNSNLSGKISASYVSDSTGTFIKFSNNSGSSAQISASSISDISQGTPVNILSVNSETTLAQLGFTGNDTLKLDYNGTKYSIAVSDSETLSKLSQDISSSTSGQVSARIDDITGKFIIETAKTGSNNVLGIENSVSSALIKSLGMNSLSLDSNGNIKPINGVDASVTIKQPDGSQITTSEESNTFTLDGINFNLKNVTSSPVNVSISSDAGAVRDKFKTFMDKYNNIVNEINTKINEKVSFDYAPLTNSQKGQMSASDIQAWNTKAQVGLLHNDDNLSNMLSALKNTFYDAVQGVTAGFGSSIGVDLSSDLTKDGTLVFTDGTGDAFKQALTQNGSQVISLFTQSSNSTDNTTKYNSEGVFNRISDVLTKYTGMTGVNSTESILETMAYKQDSYSIYGTSGANTFLDQMFEDNNKINELQQKYSDKKEQYYQQFSKLEQAMNTLNSQSASLLQQMSGGQG